MDFDNLGPIVLFIVYMAISAWSKQNKARQKAMPKGNTVKSSPRAPGKAAQQVGSILEQLKKELFEIDEEPLVFQKSMPVDNDEDEVEPELPLEPKPRYVEGSAAHRHAHLPSKVIKLEDSVESGQSLEEVLAPFSRLEQGIILSEIFGKPRARQSNDEWFHQS